ETDDTVGESIIPGTEDVRSQATATAVIEPRCTFDLPTGEAEDGELPPLTCEDENWLLNPDDLEVLPDPEELFDVHLA
ncbi:hypothetical protein NGM37_11330, partial [Streptomyces sp. TRM76130]|nr:hypothetical protein [Streptomyces sp. TRM76130]